MPNEMLNEDMQNLFRDLLLQKDINGERRLLQENGIDVDDKDLEEFHKKKEELFDFAKKNKDKLQKLDASEMYAVSGGWKLFKPQNAIGTLASMFWAFIRGTSVAGAGFNSFAVSVLTNVGTGIYNEYNEMFQGLCDDIDLSDLEELY